MKSTVCINIKNHIKPFKNGKRCRDKNCQSSKHWNKVGLFATKGWMCIGIDMHRARRV